MPNQILSPSERADRDIVLIDNMEMRRAGLACLLQELATANSATLSVCASPAEFADGEVASRCRMVIVSVGGSQVDDANVLAGIEQVRSCAPQASLVILADHKDPQQVVSAFNLGAQGYLSMGTEPEVAMRALGFIMCGGSYFPPQALAGLSQTTDPSAASGRSKSASGGPIMVPAGFTSRQREVLDCLRLGRSNKQIARELDMQEGTVKVHIRQILRKLRVSNRTQAALEASRLFDPGQAEAEAETQADPDAEQGQPADAAPTEQPAVTGVLTLVA